MRQRIMHGTEIDACTTQEVADIVSRAFASQPVHSYWRPKGAINLNAAGAGQSSNADLPVSSQYDWRIERITIAGAGAVNALLTFYENAANPGDMLEVMQLGTAGLYSDGFDNTLYVPANSQLLIVVTGGVANGQVNYNLQIKQIPHLDPK